MRRIIPKIFYLLLAVTALGFPIVFAVMWWVARILDFDVSILELATGALLLTVLADLFLAIANDRYVICSARLSRDYSSTVRARPEAST